MSDFKPGDLVHHGPSNEDWILSAISPDGKEVCPAGWPESIAKADHCTLIEACTQEQSDEMTARCAEIREGFPRGSWARERMRLAATLTGASQ